MKKYKKGLCLVLSCLLISVCLTGCNKTDPVAIFDFVLWGPYIEEDTVKPQVEELLQNIPELSGMDTLLSTVNTGSPDRVDASGYAAHAMMLTAMASCGEMDVTIMSKDSAERAARGGMFLPLDELFTQEELAAYEGRLLDFEEQDVTGQPLGTRTPICGIDLSDSEFFKSLLGSGDYGIYAVTDMGNPEMVKAVMTYFAGL